MIQFIDVFKMYNNAWTEYVLQHIGVIVVVMVIVAVVVVVIWVLKLWQKSDSHCKIFLFPYKLISLSYLLICSRLRMLFGLED